MRASSGPLAARLHAARRARPGRALPAHAERQNRRRALPGRNDARRPLRHQPKRRSTRSTRSSSSFGRSSSVGRRIGIRDDFFALGGHSLLAARMIAEIEARFGQRLPLTAALGGSHHRAPCGKTDRRPAPQLAAIHPSSRFSPAAKQPFFFLHGDFSGGGFYCRNLARHIDADRPFYALHPHGLHGEETPRTIAAMAASRLEEVRRLQPRGPYLLGGFCNGALVAFEMARLLQAQGETVAARRDAGR